MSSSAEEDFQDHDDINAQQESLAKKRKVQRACDICRRKKSMLSFLCLRVDLNVSNGVQFDVRIPSLDGLSANA